MRKKIYLETSEKRAGSLCFTLLTTDKINASVNHFLDSWRHEFTWDTTAIKIKYRLFKN